MKLQENKTYYWHHYFSDGFTALNPIFLNCLFFSAISAFISFIIGHRKKSCLAVFVTSFMVKSVLYGVYSIFEDSIFKYLNSKLTFFNSELMFIAILILASIIESIIYKVVLKCKYIKAILTSIVCNVCSYFIMSILYNYVDFVDNNGTLAVSFIIIGIFSIIMLFILGLRKKDLLKAIILNLVTKGIAVLLSPNLFHDSSLYFHPTNSRWPDFSDENTFLLAYICIVIIEGIIYSKLLENKHKSGIFISTISNIAGLIFISLFFHK